MSVPTSTEPNTNDNNTPPAAPTGTPPNDDGKGNGDNPTNQPQQLTDEQLALAFKHPRFKELTEAAKELKALKDQQTKADEEALKAKGEFEKLAQQREEEANTLRQQLENERINNTVYAEAMKLGAHDAAAVARLLNRDNVTVKEDGTVEGVDAAVKQLQTDSPYLFKTGATNNIGSGDTNPANGNTTTFTYSQVKDHKFYTENKDAVDQAVREGRIDMTQ